MGKGGDIIRTLYRFEKLYYFGQGAFFLTGGLVQSVVVAYYLSNQLTVKQVSFLWAFYLFAVTVCDFPTGFFADKFGRLRSWVLGFLLTGISELLFGLTHGFAIYMVLSGISALGEALMSGSLLAWVVDQAKRHEAEEKLSGIFGKGRLIGSLCRVAGGVFAGILAAQNLAWPYLYAGILTILICFLFLRFVRDENKITKPSSTGPKSNDVISNFVRNPILIGLSTLSIMTMSLHSLYQLFWQPRLIAIKTSPELIGFIFSLSVLGMGVGSYFSGKIFKNKLNFKLLISFFSGVIMTIGICLIGMFDSFLFIVLGIVAYNVSFGLFFPVFETWTNEHFEEESRAASNSLLSTISCCGVALIQAALGILYEILPPAQFSCLAFGFLIITAITIYWMYLLKLDVKFKVKNYE